MKSAIKQGCNRYRNFRSSIPKNYWIEHSERILEVVNNDKIFKFYRVQEEITELNHISLECFFNTTNSYNTSAMQKKLGMLWVIGVDINNVFKEIKYCLKKETAVENGIVIQHGNKNYL